MSWPEPGIHPNIAEAEYHAAAPASHSTIRSWIKPRKLGRVGLIGSATHALWLEGRAAFDERYISVDEDFDLRPRAGRERAAEIIGDSGKELLRFKERSLVERMFMALGRSDEAQQLIAAPGINELSVVGQFEGFSQMYRARIDMQRRASLWDLKTTNEINEAQWIDAEVKYGYFNQAAWYSALYAAVTGDQLPFGFVCVSKIEPHNVWTRIVPNHLMAVGHRWREDVLTLYERYIPKEMRDGKLTKRRQVVASPVGGTAGDCSGTEGREE